MTDSKEKGSTGAEQVKIAELTARLRSLEAELRQTKVSRDGWIARFHRSRPRQVLRSKLHDFLDFVRSQTPEWLRARVRPFYLRCYGRLFPYGLREFDSADLVSQPDEASPLSIAEDTTVSSDDARGTADRELSLSADVLQVYPTYKSKVSVVLPVWNDETFLNESIRSVLEQSYRELELLVVDDGSTVDLSPTFNRWSGDRRLRVIQRPHAGLGAALNAGFREAGGEFWTWTSADNLMRPQMIATLLDFLLRNPCVDMTYGNMDLIDGRGGPLTGSDVRLVNQRRHASHELDLPHSIETLGLEEDNFVGACFLYRRGAAQLAGEYDGTLLGTEDYDFWLRLSLAGEIRHVDTDECLYSYRIHENRLTARHGRTQIADNIRSILARHARRTAFFRRPLKVSFLWEASSGAPAEMVAGLAAAVQQIGHRVSVFSVGTAIERANELPFCAQQVNSLGDAVGEICHPDSDSHEKVTVISFLEQPEALEEYADSLTAGSGLVFSWLPPDSASERFAPEAGSRRWLLCGARGCRDSLPAAWRRRSSLLAPGMRAFRDDAKLALKARDNHYPLDELPRLDKPLVVYAGPLDDDLVNANLVRATAAKHQDLVFLLVGEATQRPVGAFSLQGRNIVCLTDKPFQQWHRYLSRAAVLFAPFERVARRASDIGDTLHCYLATGKPILATEAIGCVGLEDLPNAVIASEQDFSEALPRAIALRPNLAITDQYRLKRSAERAARDLVNLANAELFALPPGTA